LGARERYLGFGVQCLAAADVWSGMLALLQAVCAGRGSDDAADVSAGSRRQWERAAAGIICGGKAAAVDVLAKGRENHVLRLLDVSGNEIREAGAKAAAVMVVQGAHTCCCCCCCCRRRRRRRRRRYCRCSCHHLHHPAHFPVPPPTTPQDPTCSTSTSAATRSAQWVAQPSLQQRAAAAASTCSR
jgi:hypothetical protein